MTSMLLIAAVFGLVWWEPIRRLRARRDRHRRTWACQRDALRQASEGCR